MEDRLKHIREKQKKRRELLAKQVLFNNLATLNGLLSLIPYAFNATNCKLSIK